MRTAGRYDLSDDFELLDRYVGFSSEVLRLSLAFFAATGFLLSVPDDSVGASVVSVMLRLDFSKALWAGALVALSAAAAFSLGHRYTATDSMYGLIRRRRGLGDAEENVEQRDRMFRLSELALVAAPVSLALGVGLFGGSLMVGLLQ